MPIMMGPFISQSARCAPGEAARASTRRATTPLCILTDDLRGRGVTTLSPSGDDAEATGFDAAFQTSGRRSLARKRLV